MQCSPGVTRCLSVHSHGSHLIRRELEGDTERILHSPGFQAILVSPGLAKVSRRRSFRARIQRLGLAKPVPSFFRALLLSAAFSVAIFFASPVAGEEAEPIELQFEPPTQPLEPNEKRWGPKDLLAPVLDKVAEIRVDSDTENEYWVFDPVPFAGEVRILRKETSAIEVVLSGFLAGFLVELTNALLLHPLDTFKTRLQTGSGKVLPDPKLLYQRLYDGLIPVLATVPALSIFWAVKDLVRKTLILFVREKLPAPVADIVSSTLAAACGEAAYVAVKTPGEVLKIEQQAAVLEEDRLQQRYSDEDTAFSSQPFRFNPGLLLEESLRSFPILCTVDVPQVAVRTFLFVCLHDSTAVPEGAGSDILVFSIASALSSLLCTPLDVTRTQLILSRQGVERFSGTLREISERDGLPGLMAGWLPRLLWNGLIVGLVLGFCRLQYEDARAFFLVGVLDRFENIVQPVAESVW